MSAANDLIERMERETGQRIDDNDGDNAAMAGLFGAMSRALGQSPATYRDRDDVAAGIVILHQMSPEHEQEQAAKALFANVLLVGMSPDDAKTLIG